MDTSDPIIAAIEAHRRACAVTRAAFERQSAIEDELAAGARMPAGEAESVTASGRDAKIVHALPCSEHKANLRVPQLTSS